jgi:hypothetical protein
MEYDNEDEILSALNVHILVFHNSGLLKVVKTLKMHKLAKFSCPMFAAASFISTSEVRKFIWNG